MADTTHETTNPNTTKKTSLEQVQAFVESKRGKNSANSQEKKEFSQLWLTAARECGLTDGVIDTLANGIFIEGAAPLHTFLVEQPSVGNLEMIRSSRTTRNNNQGSALKLFISLLSFELSQPSSDASVPMIVDVLPTLAKNQEGKIFGILTQAVNKYLIEPIGSAIKKNHAKFPPIPYQAKPELRSVLTPALDEIGMKPKIRPEQRDAVFWLKAWLEGNGAAAEAPKPVAPANQTTEGQIAPETSTAMGVTPSQEAPSAPSIKEVIAALRLIDKELQSAKELSEKLQHQLDQERASSENLRKLLKSSQDEAASLKRKLGDSEQQVNNLSFENDKANDQLQELQASLDEANKMIETLGKSGSRESDEAIRRLTSKLRVDYQDYLDAVEQPMTVDLGENMRFQLESIFRTLKSSGLQL